MDRRKLLALVGSGAVLGAANAGTSNPKKPSAGDLYCYAPDDVVVEEILVEDGYVKSGNRLARLSSLQATRFRARLESLQSLVDIYARPFTDGRITQMLETIKAEAIAADVELTARAAYLTTIKQRFEVGTASYTEVQDATSSYELARSKKLSADIQLAHEPQKTKDSTDKLTLARKHLELEQQFLTKFEELLTLRAPKDGYFTMEVGVNSFVKKGDKIGVLRP